MLPLLNRIAAMIAADTYLSNTARLGRSGGGIRVYDRYSRPKAEYPCLVLACRSSRRGSEEEDPVTVMGWLLSTKDNAPSGRVQTQLEAIYFTNAVTPHAGIKALLHQKAPEICDPANGLAVWWMEETFKSNSLAFNEETGEYSMHFQYSGLVALI